MTLSVKTNDKVYDLFINGIYVYTFTEIEFSKGWIGLYVGPDTRVIYKKITVKIDDESSSVPSELSAFPDDRKSLNLVIARLKEVIQKKDLRIADLENQLKDQTGLNYKADSVLLKQSQEAVARVDELEIELEKASEDKLKLEKELLKLQQFKNAASGSDGGNVADNLININEELRLELQKSKKTIEELEAGLLKQQSQVDGWIKKLNQLENNTEDFKNTVQYQRKQLTVKDSIIREQQKNIERLEKVAKEAEKDKKKATAPANKDKDAKKENLFNED
jgi:chromosome segregation ATPase